MRDKNTFFWHECQKDKLLINMEWVPNTKVLLVMIPVPLSLSLDDEEKSRKSLKISVNWWRNSSVLAEWSLWSPRMKMWAMPLGAPSCRSRETWSAACARACWAARRWGGLRWCSDRVNVTGMRSLHLDGDDTDWILSLSVWNLWFKL